MFLSSTSGYSNYQTYDTTPVAETKNIDICVGGFSGSDSNYAMYKSNCFDLMKERCSKEWDTTCEAYVKQTNPKEEEMFRSLVSREVTPLSVPNNCYQTINPMVPSQSARYGMNPQYYHGIPIPVSCNQSGYPYSNVQENKAIQQIDIQQFVQEKKQIQLITQLPQEKKEIQLVTQQLAREKENQLINEQQAEREKQQQRLFIEQQDQLQQEAEQKQRMEALQLQTFEEERQQREQELLEKENKIRQEQEEYHRRFLEKEDQRHMEDEWREKLRKEEEERVRILMEEEVEKINVRNEENRQLEEQHLAEKKREEERHRKPIIGREINIPVETDFYTSMMNPTGDCTTSCDVSKLLRDA